MDGARGGVGAENRETHEKKVAPSYVQSLILEMAKRGGERRDSNWRLTKNRY